MYDFSFEKVLQEQASEFLKNNYLLVNGIAIYPKEIEVYYYAPGQFEDDTVHGNKLQENNPNKFYVHRYGKEDDSQYKSSPNNNRGGCDFVISEKNGVYHSYLIRSIVIDGELIVGPRKSLNAITEKTGLSYEELEKAQVIVKPIKKSYDVFTTSRIGLGKPVNSDDACYREAKLRFILCDKYFKQRDKNNVGYPKRTEAIDDFLRDNIISGSMTKEQAAKYSSKWYRAVSKEFK